MNFYLVAFVIAAILFSIFGPYNLVTSGQPIGAVIFFIGAILVFVFYGLRWFGPQGSPFDKSPGQWPPVINSCPDFLTYFKRTKPDGSTVDTCIDRIGVSRNNSLQVFPTGKNPTVPESDSYYFELKTTSQDPAAQRIELCQRTMQYGLTWEGVSDGETCYSSNGKGEAVIPVAPSACPSS